MSIPEKQVDNLVDLVLDIAGIDDLFLISADASMLLMRLRGLLAQARTIVANIKEDLS